MLGVGVGILGDARIILPLRNLNGNPTLPPPQFPNCLPLPPLLILITVSIIWITLLEEFSIFAQTEQVSKQGDHSTQVFPLPLLYPHYDLHLNHLLPINQHKKTWLSSLFSGQTKDNTIISTFVKNLIYQQIANNNMRIRRR